MLNYVCLELSEHVLKHVCLLLGHNIKEFLLSEYKIFKRDENRDRNKSVSQRKYIASGSDEVLTYHLPLSDKCIEFYPQEKLAKLEQIGNT